MSLELRVLREEFTTKSTVGRLFYRFAPTDPWSWICYTLEDAVREAPGVPVTAWKVPDATAIPVGLYALSVTVSARFSANAGHPVSLPLLANVPGFAGVRMHGGNTAEDTEGCILVAYEHPITDLIRKTAIGDVLAIIETVGNAATVLVEGLRP